VQGRLTTTPSPG